MAHENPQEPQTLAADRNIDESRQIRIVVIGGGISGIISAIRFLQRIPNVSLQVYEKNEDVGGTWFENRYPGCACDIPAYSYQATFEPSLKWSKFYAPAREIFDYWKSIAVKYDCLRHIKLLHEVSEARWDDVAARWRLKVRDITSGTVIDDSCHILVSGTGPLNDFRWPDIPGLALYQGKLLHSARWDEHYDWTGKRVAIIGNGSSGVQILPAMKPKSARIDHYIREATWIAPAQMGSDLLPNLHMQPGNQLAFAPEQVEIFSNDPKAYLELRMELERARHRSFKIMYKGSLVQRETSTRFMESMKARLASKPEILDSLLPTYPLGCRRLTPAPGYLEALVDPKVHLITTGIERVDEGGITTQDGIRREVDAIVCATGFNTKFLPRFPIIGKNGLSLAEKWENVPATYLSMTVDGFPNFFMTLGPNSASLVGLALVVEKQVDYFTDLISKMQKEHIRTLSPKASAVDGFTRFTDEFTQKTVYTTNCRSWFKGGTVDGRVNAGWPGSPLHMFEALKKPRYEDYDFEYVDNNPLGWLGNGETKADNDGVYDIYYLEDAAIDRPAVQVLPDTGHANGKL